MQRDILKIRNSFDGEFSSTCQNDAVPATLRTLFDMIINNPTAVKESDEQRVPSQACLSISQLLLINSVATDRTGSVTRHAQAKECPLPIYVAMKIHGTTRSKTLVKSRHKMGLCISYDRLLSLSTDIANTVCASYESEEVVCSPKLKSSLFTTATVDNIDHNPSSTTAQDSFHGTAISLVQHSTDDESGTEREQPTIQSSAKSSKTVAALPSSFTEVAPASLKTDPVSSPQSIAVSKHLRSTDCKKNNRESDWLENVKEILSKEKLEVRDVVS